MIIKENTKIKIGVDLHGVIDDNTDLFKSISSMLLFSNLCDVNIYIISGPPKTDVLKELNQLKIYKNVHYTEIYTIVDFLKEQDVEMWLDYKNTWWASDEDWWEAKAKICEKLDIDIMIDNTNRYKPYFDKRNIKFIVYTN